MLPTKQTKISPELAKLTEDPDWEGIGCRIEGYRLVKGYSIEELSEKLHISKDTLENLESGGFYRTQNHLWNFIETEKVSIAWLYNGDGEYNSEDPSELLPSTIVRERGAGIRPRQVRLDAEEGRYEGDPMEFVLAVDEYKRCNRIAFPSWTEVYELFLRLGYRKVTNATINPSNGDQSSITPRERIVT